MQLILKILNYWLRYLDLRVEVKKVSGRALREGKLIFANRTIRYSERGFYYLDPMPSEAQLSIYYENSYWLSRGGKGYALNKRDIRHFLFLREQLSKSFDSFSNVKFLNFGAGHGGVSYLFYLAGAKVINIEPSTSKSSGHSDWMAKKSLAEVESGSVNIFYGSHSLEHVADIDDHLSEVRRVLKKSDGYLFWEVPNGGHPMTGGCEGRIHVPHTYYFTKKFFSELDYQCLWLDYHSDSYLAGQVDVIENQTKEAVICYLAKT